MKKCANMKMKTEIYSAIGEESCVSEICYCKIMNDDLYDKLVEMGVVSTFATRDSKFCHIYPDVEQCPAYKEGK